MKFSLKTLIWSTIAIALLLAGVFAMVPKPIEVELAKAKIQNLRVTVREDGKTRIREKYIVSAPVMGQVSRIELKAGDTSEQGTLLAVIMPSDPAILDARTLAQAKARVQAGSAALQRAKSGAEQARINHRLNETKLDRAEKLLPKQAISQDEYDLVQSDTLATAQAIKTASFAVEIAQFELEMAEAAVRQFNASDDETAVEPFEIRAPISGKVLRVFEESATVVHVGTPLLELGDPQNLEIEIDVLSTDAVRIEPGADITVDHWGGESALHGQVRVIEPGAFTKISSLGVEEQRVNIIADFNEPPERIASLGDGYRVEAQITVNELQDALCIPNSALFRYQQEWHVFCVRDGKSELRRVKIGLQNANHTQVLEGIEADEVVVLYPGDAVGPGSRVRSASMETAAGSSPEGS